MKKSIRAVLLATIFIVGLVGCSKSEPPAPPLTSEKINETLESCTEKKRLTHIVTNGWEVVQIYCEPGKGD